MIAPLIAQTETLARAKTPWRDLLLPRTELPAENNALTRWRPLFPRLFPDDAGLREHLRAGASPLENPEVVADPELKTWIASLTPVLSELVVRENEALQFPELLGPGTPFPDHQPLRQLALVRTVALKAAWLDGRRDEALAFAFENLALSRVLLRTQEGLLPLINATGVWQLSLDGVYWLARQPDLTPSQAARLQLALFGDERLAADALIRAFRGEFTFFTHFLAQRLPQTNDVELLLSGIGSFGLEPAISPPEGEPRLALAAREPFDREATLQAAAEDVQGWLNAFATSRHPRGLFATHTQARLKGYAQEIHALLRYAVQDTPGDGVQVGTVDAEIAAVENPVGKLFLVITTPQWEALSVSVFRREAQRGALTALLAWRRLGRPAAWKELVTAGLLATSPADPFSTGALRCKPGSSRIWSVGENGIDDGGAGDGENLGHPLDIVWSL